MSTVLLPWPPSTNRLYRALGRGRAVISKEYHRWMDLADVAILQQRPLPCDGPVEVTVTLCPPTRIAYDPDNKLKCLLDALVRNRLITDDSNRYMKRLVLEEGGTEAGAKIEVKGYAG